MTTILSFTAVTVRNLSQILFEDLRFNINTGEHWALVGPSGSGKTALLETIAGNLHISRGEVRHPLLDPIVQKIQAEAPLFNWHRLIAKVSSKYNFRNLSNTTDLYYQQRYNSFDSEDAATVEQFLTNIHPHTQGYWTYSKVTERLNLQPLITRQLIKLSNGETKRLLIAAALIKNPVLLLLDNPLAGLDVQVRKDFNLLLSEIAGSGISIITATSPREIPDVITHVAVLNKGKITASVTKDNFNADQAGDSIKDSIDNDELGSLFPNHAEHYYRAVIDMKDVVIKYGEDIILDHINWKVKQGDRWALTGHNGAGKSMLLSLINGDNPQAYANNIILFDRKRGSGESIWDIKKKTGFVSPELLQYFPGEITCMHVTESGLYDTLGLFRKSNSANAQLSKRWMRFLGIEDSSDKLFKNVSASVQRLCLLARALIKNPPLLIFDEPCQGLDTHQQEHFKHIVEELCSHTNVTLIYVSHYQEELPASITHTLRLEKGKIA